MTREWSPFQNAIFLEFDQGSGHMFIDAGAGSGKTTTIVELARRIMEKHPAAKCLFVAFNKHIVDALNKVLPKGVLASTVHSTGLKMLNHFIKKKKGIKIKVENFKYDDICKEIIKEELGIEKWSELLKLSSQLNELVNMMMVTLTKPTDEGIAKVIDEYSIEITDERVLPLVSKVMKEGKHQFIYADIIAFVDMIWLPNELELDSPDTYDFILADESQDFSAAQLGILFKILAKDGRIFAVGDPDQSIMKFGGAMPYAVQEFITKADAKVMPLSICYRCPHSHLELARNIVSKIQDREDAPPGIIEYIPQKDIFKHIKVGDMVLCRLTAPLVSTCVRLIAKKIPAKVKGREIGKTLTKLVRECKDDDNYTWESFVESLERITVTKANKLIGKRSKELQLTMLYDKRDAIIECHASAEFNTTSMESFIGDIEGMFTDNKESITLSTVHKAKGLEANRVFIIDTFGGKVCMPLAFDGESDADTEQELNIIYVALTRAKEHLYIVSDQQRKPWYEQGIKQFAARYKNKKGMNGNVHS